MESPQPVHKTYPIPLEEFQAGYLKPFSHSQEEISDVIINHMSRKPADLTTRQREAIARFKYQGSWNLAEPENLQDLKKFFDIFNDVFFNGVLTGHCRVEVLEPKWAILRMGFVTLGFCETLYPGFEPDPRFRVENPSSTIVINKPNSKDQRSAFGRIKRCLETLLHEMLHAVFEIFTCPCGYGCSERNPRGGHNVYWQAAAYAIEKSDMVGGNLLGLNLEWDRNSDMAYDAHLGHTLPNDVVLRSLDLDILEIWYQMKNHRRTGYAMGKRDENAPLRTNRCIKSNWVFDW